MKRFLLVILVSACMACGVVHAETVTRKEAERVATAFFNAAYGEITAPPKVVWDGRQLTTRRLFVPIYVFNSPRGGYVIVSAENKVYPILGYSLSRKFDQSKLSDDETELLRKYAREIELIRYDSRIPDKAIKAWQNMAQTIDDMLHRPYASDEYRALDSEAQEKLESIDRLGKQVLLPKASEFELYDPDQYREYNLEDVLSSEEAEEIPFSFYESFLRSIEEEKRTRALELEELLSPSKPVVKGQGGGHFRIEFPEDVRIARVYAIAGMQVMEKYYRQTNAVNLDLGVLASGYYVAIVMGESGKLYGLKLYR